MALESSTLALEHLSLDSRTPHYLNGIHALQTSHSSNNSSHQGSPPLSSSNSSTSHQGSLDDLDSLEQPEKGLNGPVGGASAGGGGGGPDGTASLAPGAGQGAGNGGGPGLGLGLDLYQLQQLQLQQLLQHQAQQAYLQQVSTPFQHKHQQQILIQQQLQQQQQLHASNNAAGTNGRAPQGIHSLNKHLLRYIFSFLAVQHYDYLNHRTHTLYHHLQPVGLVCKAWNKIASPLLWQERTFHGWKAGEELNVFLQLTENADFSSTHEYGDFVRRIEIIDSHDVVDKQNGQFVINWITPDVVLALSEHCSKQLRDLTLVFATGRKVSTETEEGLIPWGSLAESCRALNMLSLANYICPVLPVGQSHPLHIFAAHTNPLRELVLKRCKNIPSETFQLLAKTCGLALTKLVLLDSDEHLGSQEIIEFAKHCPNLRHLNVSWLESVAPKINDEALLELTSNCLNLEYISLLDANEISDLSFQTLSKLRYLRNLILPKAGTTSSGLVFSQESLVALAKGCKRLEQLHLVAPGATSSRFFEALLFCPQLQVLVIVELCKGLLIDQRFKTLGLAKYVDPEFVEAYKLVWHKKT